jgi:hypothetical protein
MLNGVTRHDTWWEVVHGHCNILNGLVDRLHAEVKGLHGSKERKSVGTVIG